MSSFNMTFPDTVLAFQILEGAGLNENQHQMALTLANDVTFKRMKEALKRVFSDKIEDENPINSSFLDVPIKQENVCYIQPSKKQKKTKYNPLTKQGIISCCAICDSKMHWAKDCQHKQIQAANIVEIDDEKEGNNEFEEVNIVLMTTVNGFSPHQPVFGKNITLPSICTDQLSADLPENEIVVKHLNTLHATRQALITAES